jgi:nitronate monooxygenase
MGLFPPPFVARLKEKRIAWFATVSTVGEARQAEDAGADVLIAQGSEAGGHRACFDAAMAERRQVGLFSLLPAVVDAVTIPIVATGGIADARESLQRCCSARVPSRSAPASCGVRKPKFSPSGQMR